MSRPERHRPAHRGRSRGRRAARLRKSHIASPSPGDARPRSSPIAALRGSLCAGSHARVVDIVHGWPSPVGVLGAVKLGAVCPRRWWLLARPRWTGTRQTVSAGVSSLEWVLGALPRSRSTIRILDLVAVTKGGDAVRRGASGDPRGAARGTADPHEPIEAAGAELATAGWLNHQHAERESMLRRRPLARAAVTTSDVVGTATWMRTASNAARIGEAVRPRRLARVRRVGLDRV